MSGEPERTDDDGEERDEEIEWGEGDPRVLFMVNLVLPTVFTTVVVYGLSYIGLTAFSVANAASVTLTFMVVAYLVTGRNRGMDHRLILCVSYP